MSEITIRRSTNGWILTQYNHDHDDVMGPLTTVHEDGGNYAAPAANEADSLGDLLYEAFGYLFQEKHQAGLEIVIHGKGREAEEMEAERDNPEPGFLLPQPAADISGICDTCGKEKEDLSIVATSNLSGLAVCGSCI